MQALGEKIKDALVVAGMAAIVSFITVFFDSLGLPVPELPDINIVGAAPAAAADLAQQIAERDSTIAAEATKNAAISIPVAIAIVQFVFSFFFKSKS